MPESFGYVALYAGALYECEDAIVINLPDGDCGFRTVTSEADERQIFISGLPEKEWKEWLEKQEAKDES